MYVYVQGKYKNVVEQFRLRSRSSMRQNSCNGRKPYRTWGMCGRVNAPVEQTDIVNRYSLSRDPITIPRSGANPVVFPLSIMQVTDE